MKFAHLADAHLGYEQYHLPFRAEDFAKSFKFAVEKAIEEDVDFAIISGDLFHRSNPNPKTIKQAIDILSMLKEENIPIFAIEGNHDKTVKDVSIYDLLESLGLLYKLGLRRKLVEGEFVRSKSFGDYNLVYGVFEDFKIFGDTHRSSHQFKSLMEEKYIPSCDIAVLHLSVKEVVDLDIKDDYVTISDLPRAKYYALGHVHIPIKKNVNGSWFVYPGCPERSDAREYSIKIDYFDDFCVSEGCKKGLFIVENFKPRFVEVSCRDLISANISAKDQRDAVNRVKEILDYLNSESILILRIFSESVIDLEDLVKIVERRVRHVKISLERISKEREIKIERPSEFFTEFELSLLEFLKRPDFDNFINTVIGLIEKEFKLRDFKVLDDFKVKSVGVENEDKKEDKKDEKKKLVRKNRRTLFDFVEG
ncbi:DNA repair exonuclease [Archaeoglobus profundus]|uniref:DNA double-strand break repair protein Mre11 n=1 Tax=Archaeoglobus profundus (strain DSM 5631 / JCM 9629 / NBRC 100127 / Av18) TaxID=572546 RepID=D2RFR0_ARCPA|nr:exonuclease SbcCD subunit D [Archaeoglobus profundus]ADB57135.1 metallophosphoesterase [Archaeoglobus profundus DSM 5631]